MSRAVTNLTALPPGEFAPGSETQSGTMEIATSRSAQEIQAAMIVAMRNPRDQRRAYSRIMNACKRVKLAEGATYSYPRGTSKVEGPTIRLAEVLAQNWGNMDFGLIELERDGDKSSIMAYAWDLETNTRQTKIFHVHHVRYSKKKGLEGLTDPRDVYEVVASQGARRLRACILGIIPGDIVDDALEACEKTLLGDGSETLQDRIRKMTSKFSEVGVSDSQIQARLGHKIDSTTIHEVVGLGKIYNSIANGMGKVSDWFSDVQPATVEEIRQAQQERLSGAEQADEVPVKVQPPAEPEVPAEQPSETIRRISAIFDELHLTVASELSYVQHVGGTILSELTPEQAEKLLATMELRMKGQEL